MTLAETCEVDAPTGSDGWPGFAWTILQRHGRRPLAVHARALLRADNGCAGLPWRSSVIVLETSSGQPVAAVCHMAEDDDEQAWRDATVYADAAALRAAMRAHDPLRALPSRLLLAGAVGGPDATGRQAARAAAAARGFHAAWCGLIAAVFGIGDPARG